MNCNFNPFPVLESKRLILKPLDVHHNTALYKYQSNKSNFPYVDMTVYKSIEEAEQYIEKMNLGVAENKWIIWAICLKSTGEIVGTISIWNLEEASNQGELGYGIFPEYRRVGYMKEALNKVLVYAFETMTLDRIEAYSSHENLDSVEFLKHMRFIYQATIEDEYSGGALMDVFYYKDEVN